MWCAPVAAAGETHPPPANNRYINCRILIAGFQLWNSHRGIPIAKFPSRNSHSGIPIAEFFKQVSCREYSAWFINVLPPISAHAYGGV